jgi:hypothetical protein
MLEKKSSKIFIRTFEVIILLRLAICLVALNAIGAG